MSLVALARDGVERRREDRDRESAADVRARCIAICGTRSRRRLARWFNTCGGGCRA
jgi:hypothetical protein